MRINLHFHYTSDGFNPGSEGIWEEFQQRAPILLEEALAVQTTYAEWLDAFMLEHNLSPNREADCRVGRKKILEVLAFGLAYEHANIGAVFEFIHAHEPAMFPDGLETSPDMISLHHMVEVFRENRSRQKTWPNDLLMASQQHPVSTREPDGALRDLKLYDRYLRPFWDEELYEIRKNDDFELLTKLVELELLDPRMTDDFLIQESGDKAAKLRLILTGGLEINLEEASLRFREMFRVSCGGFVHSSVYKGDRQRFFQKQMTELRHCPEYFSLPFAMDLQWMASELKFEKQDDADLPNSGLFREMLVYCNERMPNFILHVGVAFFKLNPGRVFSKNFDIAEIALAMADKLSFLAKYREKNKAVPSIQDHLLVQYEIQKSFLFLVPEAVLAALNVDNECRLTLYHATGYPALLTQLQDDALESALSFDLGL
jgi:hypothetical protein